MIAACELYYVHMVGICKALIEGFVLLKYLEGSLFSRLLQACSSAALVTRYPFLKTAGLFRKGGDLRRLSLWLSSHRVVIFSMILRRTAWLQSSNQFCEDAALSAIPKPAIPSN